MNLINSENLMNQVKNLYQSTQYNKALEILDEMTALDSSNHEAYFYMANIYHIKGQLGKAIKAFNRVLELNPMHTDASISLSVLLNDIGHYEEAKKVFETANKHVKEGNNEGLSDPHINLKFSDKHLELAELYLSYNRYEEAIFEYKKSLDLNPNNLGIRVKISKAYAKKGFISKAIEELKNLKNEQPSFLEGRNALALMYFSSGNILEAQTEWHKILTKDPANPEAKMYLSLSMNATETKLN